jgi:ligand-binding sensor domain-containing protein
MSKKCLCLILTVAMIVGFSFFGCSKKCTESKQPKKPPEWTSYNTSNSGLVYNRVNAIAIDATGNKWFGTWRGVSKFDGTNWTTYNTSNSGLAVNGVMAIAVDDSNNKWFGTWRGVSRFDGMNWTTYDTSNSGLADNDVNAICNDQIHIGHPRGRIGI